MYLYLKAFHIIFMVTWFAGLFYQFRLYVYHTESQEPKVREQLKIMEKRLYKFTTPLMILNIIFGLSIAYIYTNRFINLLDYPWLYIKMILVFLLIIYHIYSGKVLKDLSQDKCKLTSKQCRFINEIPVLFLLSIVLLATLKPSF